MSTNCTLNPPVVSVSDYAPCECEDGCLCGYADYVLGMVRADPHSYSHVLPKFQADYGVALTAVELLPANFEHVPEQLRGLSQIALAAIRRRKENFQLIPDRLRDDPGFLARAVAENARVFSEIPHRLLTRGAMLEAVKQIPWFFKSLPRVVREDYEFVLECAKLNLEVLAHVSRKMDCYRDLILELLPTAPLALKYAPDDLRGDWHVVRDAVKINPFALEFASEEIRSNYEILWRVLQVEPLVLAAASDTVLGDAQFMLKVIREYACAYAYVSPQLKQDPDFRYNAYCMNGHVANYM